MVQRNRGKEKCVCVCVPIDVVSPLANEGQELKRERERERDCMAGLGIQTVGNPDRPADCGDANMGLCGEPPCTLMLTLVA